MADSLLQGLAGVPVVVPEAIGIYRTENEVVRRPREEPPPDPEYVPKSRYEEAERKITEQGQQISSLNSTMNQLLYQSQAQQEAPQSYQSQPQSDEPFNWYEYLNSSTRQEPEEAPRTPMMEYNQQSEQMQRGPAQSGTPHQQRYLTAEDAVRLADSRIAATLDTINYQQAMASQVFEKFKREDTDLHPYAGVVQKIYATTNPAATIQDRYAYATGQVREMMQSGQLPRLETPQPQQNPYYQPVSPHGILPMSPQGGQGMYLQRPGQTQEPAQRTNWTPGEFDGFKQNELAEWTAARADELERRKQMMTKEEYERNS